MDRAQLRDKLEAAEEKFEKAGRELDTALAKLKVSVAADNVMVTNVIAKAFERLKATKRDVAELRQLVATDETD